MTNGIIRDLEWWKQNAEEHAYSVRQLIAQRARLFEMLRLASRIAKLKIEPPPNEAFSLFNVLQEAENSPSQFMQEIFCLLLCNGKTGGFFVEFGACNGLLISNTVLLEREFGWNGILTEPLPSWHEELRSNRKCIIETRCVWSRSGDEIPFGEVADDGYRTRSGIPASFTKDRNISKQYSLQTVSLFDLLREHNAPGHVDMLSVDTEGSEFDILSAFPFDQYTFGFICVEHKQEKQENPIKHLLQAVGYKQILRNISGHDGFYVPQRHPIL